MDSETMEKRRCPLCGNYFTKPMAIWCTGYFWLWCRCGGGKLITCKEYRGEKDE